MKLALDHHYTRLIAERLRERGHDVVAVIDRGWELLDDEELLDTCHAEQRALLTNNVQDFAVIARRWAADGRSHHGLIYTSDAGRPRTRAATGRFVDDLAELMTAGPATDAFIDQIWWL
ncbi:MAG TPA: DUF5615 family PIN-like protein [Ilumatobacter sp.]|nr:DUF5615 family PIN-like protein [Ilumatobacter sp.]